MQPYLIPGDYRLTVEKKGFQKHTTSDLKVSVQQTIALDIQLAVGEVTTTAEVSAGAAQLATTTSAVSTVITNKAMLDLPLNGRNHGSHQVRHQRRARVTLFEYLRNSKLDANSWANNRNGVRRAAFQRNQFGATIGGPVLLPKLYDGRNRAFFFFAEQSTRTPSQAGATATVPLPEWRNGDFSNLRNGNGQAITVF